MSDIYFNGTREDLRRLLSSFIASMSGDAGEFEPYVRGIKLRVGMVALSCIQEAFLQKSAGNVGDDGIKWAPLSKYTIARRKLGPQDKALLKGYGAQNGRDVLGRVKRGFLTPAQDERWRKIYGSRKAMFMAKHGLDEAAASEHAAQIAWATLKAEGAKTKLEALGSRKVEIGRDTGRLFNSLSPGTANPGGYPLLAQPPDAPAPSDRVLREEAGAVVVGSNVEYAADFHAARPLWPVGMPEAWQERIMDAARSGIQEAIGMILSQSGGQRAA